MWPVIRVRCNYSTTCIDARTRQVQASVKTPFNLQYNNFLRYKWNENVVRIPLIGS